MKAEFGKKFLQTLPPAQHQSLLILFCFLWFQVLLYLIGFHLSNRPIWFETFLSVFSSPSLSLIFSWFLFFFFFFFVKEGQLNSELHFPFCSSGSWNYSPMWYTGWMEKWRKKPKLNSGCQVITLCYNLWDPLVAEAMSVSISSVPKSIIHVSSAVIVYQTFFHPIKDKLLLQGDYLDSKSLDIQEIQYHTLSLSGKSSGYQREGRVLC